MTDRECVEFLQWALPKMRMRWTGFRKVRRQVCKRISRRIGALDLAGVAGYRTHLEANPAEWTTLASLCRVTISRFYRDRGVFDRIGKTILPRLAERTATDARCWSAGCASGEEAYTMQILWQLRAVLGNPEKKLRVLGTDSETHMLERARKAAYPKSALKDLPTELVAQAFEHKGDMCVLKDRFKEHVDFEEMDIRESIPPDAFDIILCRNLVFTYFEVTLQVEILTGMLRRLRDGGFLVTGVHERLPAGDFGLTARAPAIHEYNRM
jgi:chemotaxis protein methyltransferase CheR